MEKNEILKAACNNKDRGKEYENKEAMRSSLLGAAVAIILGVVLFVIEYVAKNSINVSLIAVGMTASCVQSLREGIKNQKTYLIVIGVVEALVVLFAILIFLVKVALV